MSESTLFAILIPISIVFAILIFVVRRLLTKGVNAVERTIRSDATQKADNIIGTAVIFETVAALSKVRQEIEVNVPVVSKIGHMMKVLEDSVDGISWAIGMPNAGNGAIVSLQYKEESSGTIAMFSITKHITPTTFAISPFVDQLLELRNQVIIAFKTADPAVKITADTQEVIHKTSWF